MNRKCAQTAVDFEIKKQDADFYQQISPKIAGRPCSIPPPTLSPQARLIRRLSWRNDRTFFKRKCSGSGKPFVSIYPQDVPFPVFHPDIWWGDSWNALDYGIDFSFDKPFFSQWQELLSAVPRRGIDIVNCENSYYCNYCGDAKNCYLDIAGEGNEDCYYNLFTKYSKDCVDCTFVYNSELCYESINCYRCQDVLFSYYLENCYDCAFCFDLKGCSNCLFCSNLRHKEYHIYNEPCSKQEYNDKLKQLALERFSSLEKHAASWKEVIAQAIHRDMYIINSENCLGNEIVNSKNCSDAYNISECEDCKYLYDVLDANNCYDLNYSLYKPEASYELISTLSLRYSAFSMASHYSHNIYYCDQCENSNDLFGCIGLNQQRFCILNKQYSKESYEELVPKIIEHMRKTGEWGEFFPSSMSPWGYNETVAQEYFPISKEKAEAQGFNWRDASSQAAASDENYSISDSISDIDESILEQTLSCARTGKKFRLVKSELDFYRKMKLPVPRLAPDTRHLQRLSLRTPRRLYSALCRSCKMQISTPYAPVRKESVFCEKCYLAAVH